MSLRWGSAGSFRNRDAILANAMSSKVRQLAERRVGKTLDGKWRLDALLGFGGSAAVYAATHRKRAA